MCAIGQRLWNKYFSIVTGFSVLRVLEKSAEYIAWKTHQNNCSKCRAAGGG
jgi:hypothetical protein